MDRNDDAAALDARLDQTAELLHDCRSVLFITGAGLSADAGLPTYRGVGGLYEDRGESMPIEELLSGPMLSRQPELVWKHLMQIESVCRDAKPSRGHQIIAAFESRFERVWVLTQNVDALHHAAGSTNIIDMHGDFRRIVCTGCAYETMVRDYTGLTIPPRCGDCGGDLRPAVVLFGESLPMRQVMEYRTQTRQGFDAVFSIGTTSIFPYIAAPVIDAYNDGRLTVEINPSRTEVSDHASIRLPMRASDALEGIWTRINR